jgi:predicted GTPase
MKFFTELSSLSAGAGKSTIINNLFNYSVSETFKMSDASICTSKELKYYHGDFTTSWEVNKKINIIDTVGESNGRTMITIVWFALKAKKQRCVT